ncbi:hypothetical protein BJV74DRAFT_716264, partial [Russula compacta]
QGYDAPVGVHPNFLHREGASKTNHYQLIPRVAAELMDHTCEYQNLCNSFEELFAWIKEKAYIYDELCIFADVLPGNKVSPSYPFCGIVLNINVTTAVHRDFKDLKICLVMDVGDHVGGELCLVEPGIVLRMRNGDMALFPSNRITHFNLHY